MPGMDAVDEELRTLRARAYGPHADIANDPEAVRRLQELEGLRSARRAESMSADAMTPAEAEVEPVEQRMPDAVTVADAEPDADLDTLFPVSPEHPPAADEPGAPQVPAGRRYRRRTLWITAATAAAVAAGITYAAVSFVPVSASSGAPQISTLAPMNAIEVPVGFVGAAEGSPAFEFHGLTLFLSSSGLSGVNPLEAACLMAVTSDQIPAAEDFTTDSWGVEGPIYSGCRVGVFPATIEIPLTPDAPPELREAFPGGTALQFVLDGDRVGVFLDSE